MSLIYLPLRENFLFLVQESKARQNFPRNEHFSPSLTYTYLWVSEGKKCLFFRKCCVPCLLEAPILRFALLPYYWRYALFQKPYFFLRTVRTILLSNVPWNKNFFVLCGMIAVLFPRNMDFLLLNGKWKVISSKM